MLWRVISPNLCREARIIVRIDHPSPASLTHRIGSTPDASIVMGRPMSSENLESSPVEAEGPPPAARSVGRPRRLTLAQILDAAIEMGLDGLRIAALADRLGVRPAVLYTYVTGRKELVRLAAQRASGAATFPEDEGQSWRQYATQYAQALHKLVEEGQLVSTLVSGNLGPAVEIDSSEQWLQVMLARGFDLPEALDLLRSIDLIVLGGAFLSSYARAVAGGEAEYRDAVRASIDQRSAEDVPVIAAHPDRYADTALPRWRTTLALVLDGVAARRGE